MRRRYETHRAIIVAMKRHRRLFNVVMSHGTHQPCRHQQRSTETAVDTAYATFISADTGKGMKYTLLRREDVHVVNTTVEQRRNAITITLRHGTLRRRHATSKRRSQTMFATRHQTSSPPYAAKRRRYKSVVHR
jgi:hypothetical protein